MALRVTGVRKCFGDRTVLEQVSLVLEAGEIYGFLGQNGAGKTTLLRIVLGLQSADAGQVEVDGWNAHSAGPQVRARIGALIEVPGAWERWSARANLMELAQLQGMSSQASAQEAQRVLSTVGLEAAADRPAGTFSQGMRQRLGIAAALLGDPRYLILDEPLNGLDPENLAQVREVLRELAARGTGILISSHQLAEIAPLTSKIGVLKDGRIVVEASADELLRGGAAAVLVETADCEPAQRVLQQHGVTHVRHARGWRVDPAPPADQLARWLLDAKVSFVALSRVERTLEEVYLAVNRGEKTSAATRSAASSEAKGPSLAPKHGLSRAFAHEWRRLSRAHAVAWMAGVSSLVALGAAASRWLESQALAAEVAAGTLATASGLSGYELVARGMIAALPVLGVMAAGFASQSIAGEQSRGTLRNVLLRPLERWELTLGKLLAGLTTMLSAYMVLALVLMLAAWSTAGFGDVVEILATGEPFVITQAAELAPELAWAWIAPLGALSALLCLGFLAGAWARGAAAALGLALGLVLALDLARVFTRSWKLDAILPAEHTPSPLGDASYPRALLELSQGISTQLDPSVSQAALIGILWVLVLAALSTWLIRTKSVA